ncbi:MAG TPA: glycosyltransferase [Pyrinomonadaceae bacterium]
MSICVPTHNGAAYLRQALESALAQTFPDFELLIVDDASTDKTLLLVQEVARRDSRVRLYSNPRRLGLGGNWNRCLELARGEWIKFLFQDDYLHPLCVERMYECGSQGGATLVASRRNFVFESGVKESFRRTFLEYVAANELSRRFPQRSFIGPEEFAAHAARHPLVNCIGEPTAIMFKRAAVRRFGLFQTDLLQLVDWEYCMRLAVNTGLYFINEELATFRLHEHAATLSNNAASQLIDFLIIQHELVYAPHYAPVRRAARRASPPIDLKRQLASLFERARLTTREDTGAQRNSRAELKRIIKKYPRLGLLPLTGWTTRLRRKVLPPVKN